MARITLVLRPDEKLFLEIFALFAYLIFEKIAFVVVIHLLKLFSLLLLYVLLLLFSFDRRLRVEWRTREITRHGFCDPFFRSSCWAVRSLLPIPRDKEVHSCRGEKYCRLFFSSWKWQIFQFKYEFLRFFFRTNT